MCQSLMGEQREQVLRACCASTTMLQRRMEPQGRISIVRKEPLGLKLDLNPAEAARAYRGKRLTYFPPRHPSVSQRTGLHVMLDLN